jgi:hypothetical protein
MQSNNLLCWMAASIEKVALQLTLPALQLSLFALQ